MRRLHRKRKTPRMLGAFTAAVAAVMFISSCSSGPSDSAQSSGDTNTAEATSTSASTSASAEQSGSASQGAGDVPDPSSLVAPSMTDEQKAALERIPEALRANYAGYWYFTPLDDNPYASWTPPKPPWKFCYSDSYQGNDWRKTALAEYQHLVDQLQQKGLATGPLTVTNSNNDINTQLAQINNLVGEGCNVIEAIPASSTGLCSAAKAALDKGVLFVTMEGPLMDCKYAINVDFNEYWAGQITAQWIVNALNGKGNVLLANGIPGLPPTIARRQAVLDTLKQNSGIKVVGEITGQWTPSVAKSETLKFLGTHPQKIDAVWNSSQMMTAIGDAFLQSGREIPKINAFSGSCATLAYWKEHNMDSFGLNQAGAPAMYEGMHVALRMLAGQQPVSNAILYPVPVITQDNFSQWYKPDMTVRSTCFSSPPDGKAVADSYFDDLFKGGQPAVELQP